MFNIILYCTMFFVALRNNPSSRHRLHIVIDVFACGRETVRAFYNFLNLHTCSMLRNIWACTHVRCYATSGLAHMFDATQHLGLHTCSMLRNIWACTHGCCYATPWVGVGWGVGGVGMMMFFGLAHMLDATELLMFFRACTHVGCYGTADVL